MDERESAQEEKILVQAPRGLPPAMLTAYVDRCLASLALAKSALERSDCDHLRVFGHHLKGSGGGYGIPMLTEVGRLIEAAAMRSDTVELRGRLSEIERYLSRLDILSS